ncbi:hypothetical protein ETAA8_15740 [Anatilimnocola aggregata]|uniref:DUF1501 domain-containing protein n=1 Tax=Anatilimnocola aggregata TaxID=2528021 RepID=A0A517Y8E3_9BACT|nr:DUF1501 domain-containing protein [Anatilimnocola aggregata]QDU26496.1 hypothetical protein ETAA8_15740 [Anatilimnocola aggregata]
MQTSTQLSRRHLLTQAGGGAGMLALAALLADEGLLSNSLAAESATSKGTAPLNPLAPHAGHFPAKAKNVIWLFMNGGPSQVDTWDYKPELEKRDGQELKGFDKNTGFFTGQVGPVMKSPFKFAQHGKSGAWVSDIFPGMAQHVDDMAFVHSCYTGSNNHSPALFMINTGMAKMGHPCVGSWVTYGLGSESQSLPAFVAMTDPLGRGLPKGYSQNWGAGFLPSVYQGTWLKPSGDAIDNLYRPADQGDKQQRAALDLLARLNRKQLAERPHEAELAARIESFELAYRMQLAAPEAIDIQQEPEHIHKLYGVGEKRCDHFAKQCLMARRLVERGVRFVQIYSGGMENERSWDGHKDIKGNHEQFAGETDTPIAGLLADLKQRGLLENTLVVWGGEFGRLPIVQTGGTGRDHNPHAFTYWLAGGGVKGGVKHGATDELGHKAVEDRVHVNDLHATILHLLGLDHQKLTFRMSGRDFRLTDVAGHVVKEVLA